MLEFAEVLEQYFLKHGKRDNYIWTINLLGGIHNAMPDRQDGEKAAWYFQKLRSFKDCYFEIENDDVSSFWEKSAVQSFLRATKHFVIMQLHMISWVKSFIPLLSFRTVVHGWSMRQIPMTFFMLE